MAFIEAKPNQEFQTSSIETRGLQWLDAVCFRTQISQRTAKCSEWYFFLLDSSV